jgi:hypothetical protein
VISKAEGKVHEYILHDNVEDPYQLENIAAERPEVFKELREELERWLLKNNDPWLQSSAK